MTQNIRRIIVAPELEISVVESQPTVDDVHSHHLTLTKEEAAGLMVRTKTLTEVSRITGRIPAFNLDSEPLAVHRAPPSRIAGELLA